MYVILDISKLTFMSLRSKWTGLKEILVFDNRFALIATKLFFPRERLQIYRQNGIQFLSDHDAGDANGAREVLTSPMYRDLLNDLEFQHPINVLDLGANNGGFPLLLKSIGIVMKKAVSIELNPKTWVRLHFNLHRNLDCEVEALNAAVCGTNDRITVSLGEGDVSDNIYVESTNSSTPDIDIPGITFDRLFETHFGDELVDICKIDIEGAEFEIFRGDEHSRIRKCRFVIMEIHERVDRGAGELITILEGMNFDRQPTKPNADPTVHLFINNSIS